MYKVISGENAHDIEVIDPLKIFEVNGNKTEINVEKISDTKFHVLQNNQGFNVEVIDFNRHEKKISLKVNNNIFDFAVKDEMDILLEKMGLHNATTKKVSEIKAPMPGLVLNISVSTGSVVKKGDALLILEAMKMENVIKSPVDGEVKSIDVKQGDPVEKNQVLIQFK